MQARLKTSIQWTPFPAELCENAVLVLNERFKEEYDLENGEFTVEGRIYNHEIVGRYGLRIKNQLKQYNFEVSFDFDPEKDKALEMIQDSMDLVEHLWTEFLEEDRDDSELTVLWQSIPYKNANYFFRYSTVNSQLELEADQLLAQYEKKLVYDTPIEEELEYTTSEVETDDKTLH